MKIPLSQGKFAIIDDADAPRVAAVPWHINAGYARNMRQGYMHRLIAGAEANEEVDHINGDRLDNRKSNLRRCARLENSRNISAHTDGSSRFKGVYWHAQRGKWHAQIKVGSRRLSLGLHAAEEAAAVRYDQAAREHYGEFARLNFPAGA